MALLTWHSSKAACTDNSKTSNSLLSEQYYFGNVDMKQKSINYKGTGIKTLREGEKKKKEKKGGGGGGGRKGKKKEMEAF